MCRFLRHWGWKIKGRSKVLKRARGPSIQWKRNHSERHSALRDLRKTPCQEQLRAIWASNHIKKNKCMLSVMELSECKLGYTLAGTSTTWSCKLCKTHCFLSVSSGEIEGRHVWVSSFTLLGWYVSLYKPSHMLWEGFGTQKIENTLLLRKHYLSVCLGVEGDRYSVVREIL